MHCPAFVVYKFVTRNQTWPRATGRGNLSLVVFAQLGATKALLTHQETVSKASSALVRPELGAFEADAGAGETFSSSSELATIFWCKSRALRRSIAGEKLAKLSSCALFVRRKYSNEPKRRAHQCQQPSSQPLGSWWRTWVVGWTTACQLGVRARPRNGWGRGGGGGGRGCLLFVRHSWFFAAWNEMLLNSRAPERASERASERGAFSAPYGEQWILWGCAWPRLNATGKWNRLNGEVVKKCFSPAKRTQDIMSILNWLTEKKKDTGTTQVTGPWSYFFLLAFLASLHLWAPRITQRKNIPYADPLMSYRAYSCFRVLLHSASAPLTTRPGSIRRL